MKEYLFHYKTQGDDVDLAIIHAPNMQYAEENFNLWYIKPLKVLMYSVYELSEPTKNVRLEQ